MPRPSTTLHLGDTAPDFQLTDAATGVSRSLTSLLGDRRGLLLVFHRGMW
jgi:peroxiredoxin